MRFSFEVAKYGITHYAVDGGGGSGLIYLINDAWDGGGGQVRWVEVFFNRNPDQPESVSQIRSYDSDGNAQSFNMQLRTSRHSEWIDTLRNENPVWIWWDEFWDGGNLRPYAGLDTGSEPVGENEMQARITYMQPTP